MTQPWADKTVFVTGGLGFIGSHFVEQLLALEANVVCLHRGDKRQMLSELPSSDRLRLLQLDLLDYQEMVAACRYVARRVDAIVHCAALDGNTEFKLKHSAQILDTNLRITSNVLNCARDYGVQDVVLLSSAEIYSLPSPQPLVEEDDYRRYMSYSANGYFLSKMLTEVLADLHRQQFGMRIFLPRPTNVYGPRDNFLTATNRVIPSMLTRLAAGQDVEIWGDGRQTRSFIHVSDLVRATLQMVERNVYHTLNMGTGESVSIVELAHLVAAALGVRDRIRLNADRPAGASSRTLDVERMSSTIDFTPRSLHSGLRDTVAWYRGWQAHVESVAPTPSPAAPGSTQPTTARASAGCVSASTTSTTTASHVSVRRSVA